MQKIATTAHLVTTGSAKETDAANKSSFFSKTKPPFTFKQAAES
jgi:hypothetical protein